MRDHRLYLQDIVAAMTAIESFVAGMDFNAFNNDDKTISAVLRKLEVIGEAVKQLPETLRDAHPHIPWKEMAGMRDRLIHFYFGVDTQLVWRTATERIPNVKRDVQTLMNGGN